MRQSRPFTCGPAAAASLLRAWGIPAREGALAYAARTSFRGTELPRLADAIRHFGRYKPLRVKILSITFEELRVRNRPAILLVRRGRRRHVVTLLRMTENELAGIVLTIADPASGTQRFRLDEFGDWYDWNGRAIVAWRDSAFETRSGEPPEPSLHN